MEEMVKVSLMGKRSFRPGKGQPTINYKMGINEMPLEHARAMGLMHRIVKPVPFVEGETPIVQKVMFDGRFDERLTNTLLGAGYTTLDDLAKASRDELMAVDGIGPAAYEKIYHALHGGLE